MSEPSEVRPNEKHAAVISSTLPHQHPLVMSRVLQNKNSKHTACIITMSSGPVPNIELLHKNVSSAMSTEQNTYVTEQDSKFTATLQLHEAVVLFRNPKTERRRGCSRALPRARRISFELVESRGRAVNQM